MSDYGFIVATPSQHKCIHRYTYLGTYHKMHWPSVQDLVQAISQAGKCSYLYCSNIARVYWHIPLDLAEWLFVCSKYKGSTIWTSACRSAFAEWQLATKTSPSSSLGGLNSKGLSLLNYIDDFGGVASTEAEATSHFNSLCDLLKHLGLQEAAHKAHPPLQVMTWLGLNFDAISMTVTIPEDKMSDTMQLINS